MKLGDKVKIQRYIAKSSYQPDKETTKKFAEDHGLEFKEDTSYINGYKIPYCPWYGFRLEEETEGIICGTRTIKGYVTYDWEDGVEQGAPIQVYLVATKLSGFYRVPAKWLDKQIERRVD